MIQAVFRTLLGILLGLFSTFVPVVAVELFSSVVHPLPQDFGGTMDEMCLHVSRYPTWVLAAVVPMWTGAAVLGSWLAQRVGNAVAAIIVGALLSAALVYNVAKLPYALWFKIVILLAVPAGLAGGALLGKRRRAPQR